MTKPERDLYKQAAMKAMETLLEVLSDAGVCNLTAVLLSSLHLHEEQQESMRGLGLRTMSTDADCPQASSRPPGLLDALGRH